MFADCVFKEQWGFVLYESPVIQFFTGLRPVYHSFEGLSSSSKGDMRSGKSCFIPIILKYSGSGNKRKAFKIKDLKLGTDAIFLYSVILGKSAPEIKRARKNRFFYTHVKMFFL